VDTERLTVPSLVHRQAAEIPDADFVVTDTERLTFAELDMRSRVLAAGFVARGVGKGTRVALLMPNGVDWVVVAIALARVGAVLVPLSTLLRPPELEAQLRVAGVDHLVFEPSFRGRDYVGDLATLGPLPRLRTRMTPTDVADLPAGRVTDEIVDGLGRAVRPADDLVIVFTSGSRGAPKGVIHTHGGALGATRAGLAARGLGPGDRLYIPMPFFWVGGLGTGLLSALVAGATLITERQPEAAATLRLLERERVTLFRGWPDQAVAIAAHPDFASTDLSHLKPYSLPAVLPTAARGAAGGRPNLLGMTESFGPYCADRLDQDLPPHKRGSCGRPFADVEVRIVDVDHHRELPSGETGEIQLRGPNLMRGICGRTRDEVFTADGFYPTGDLGYLDPDGYLFFVGRRDDMFKVKGATVYPSEVEAALQSISAVQRAVVVDLGVSPAVRVGALVVLQPGAEAGVEELRREAAERLSSFKVPTAWAIVDAGDVPLLASGKVDKTGVQRLLDLPATHEEI
jgi:acyl-CoA synthetase (AMP-forming)/AMP-acid ligase II